MRTTGRAALIGLCLFAYPAHADSDGQVWANALVQAPLNDNLLLWFDTSARFTDDATRLGQTLFRGGLGTRLNGHLAVHAGYVHVRTTPASGPRTVEHRGWQQALYPIIRGKRAQLVGRTRLEQRWLEGRDGMSLRARQLVRLNVPLGGKTAPRAIPDPRRHRLEPGRGLRPAPQLRRDRSAHGPPCAGNRGLFPAFPPARTGPGEQGTERHPGRKLLGSVDTYCSHRMVAASVTTAR
jgi:Protein of unknown function (DUF2490)